MKRNAYSEKSIIFPTLIPSIFTSVKMNNKLDSCEQVIDYSQGLISFLGNKVSLKAFKIEKF